MTNEILETETLFHSKKYLLEMPRFYAKIHFKVHQRN